MSEQQQYYNAFRTGYWANPDANRCRCRGSGWALSEVDTWHECPIHYKGQIHPESYDGEEGWEEANQESMRRWEEEHKHRLVESGVELPNGTPACGVCGGFDHKHGECPPEKWTEEEGLV